jgi:hypothetical protein
MVCFPGSLGSADSTQRVKHWFSDSGLIIFNRHSSQ